MKKRNGFALCIALLLISITHLSAAQDRVTIQGKELFLSGINIAWDRYANDVGDTPIDVNKFREIVVNVRAAGGNVLRWWLSTNGANDPKFDAETGLVSGLGSETINNVQKVLDICEENGVVVSLCLLSHNYLQEQSGMNLEHNKKMLTTDEGLQAYIDNALVPLVTAIGNHPAIACWEIFNEPEGMVDGNGWAVHADGSGFTMERLQIFVNRCAGAIKRVNDSLLVSNGSHTFKFSSDVADFKNYYSDAALIAAGGDSNGTLDFYMIHFYPHHQGDDLSPFHNPASHWGLDKPIVVGEFPNVGVKPIDGKFKVSSELTPVEAFNYLYDNGYAGGLSWPYTGHDGLGTFEDVKPALLHMYETHKEDIFISELAADTAKGNYAMQLTFDNLSETNNKEWVSKNYSEDLSGFSNISLEVKVDSVISGESVQIRFVSKSGNWQWVQANALFTVPVDGKWHTYEIALSDMAGIQLGDMKSLLIQVFPSGSEPFSGKVLVDNVNVDDIVVSDFDDQYSLWGAGEQSVAISDISAVKVDSGGTPIGEITTIASTPAEILFKEGCLLFSSPTESSGFVRIIGLNGQVLNTQHFELGTTAFSIGSGLSKGVYFLRIETEERLVSKTLLVE